MVILDELYKSVTAALNDAGIENSRFEARCIISHVLKLDTSRIITEVEKYTSDEQAESIRKIVEARINGEPLQYLIGEWECYGLTFKVGKGVLIPRQDTETLIDFAVEYLKNKVNPKVIDLCSGSGCIAVAVKNHISTAEMYAVEKSEEALKYLKENVYLHKSYVFIVSGDVTDEKLAGKYQDFDLILSNPPYLTKDDMLNLQTEVSFEPESALFGGENGLYFYYKITEIWKKTLKKGGIIAFEIGIGQENDVIRILTNNGFKVIGQRKDLNGIIRVIIAELIEKY